MNIFYNGKAKGEWDLVLLPKLAESLETTVEELITQSEAFEAKAAFKANMSQKMAAQVGDTPKVLGIVADCALVSLIVGGVMIKTADEGHRAKMNVFLSEIMGEGADEKLVALVDDIISGDVNTPVQIKGLERVMNDARDCANGASSVIAQVLSAAQEQREEGQT